MPKINRPRRGSLAYSPRKRAQSPIPKYKSWPEHTGAPALLGFAGYKVGMTHVLMVDDHKDSPTEGKEIMVPVTIIEIPTMKVAAIRAYSQDTYGRHAFTEIWAEPMDSQLSRRVTVPKNYDSTAAKKKCADALAAGLVAEIYAVAYTQPATMTGVPKKVPDIMEIKIAGGDCAKQYEFALGLLGKEIRLNNVIRPVHMPISLQSPSVKARGDRSSAGESLSERGNTLSVGKSVMLVRSGHGTPTMCGGKSRRAARWATSSAPSSTSAF